MKNIVKRVCELNEIIPGTQEYKYKTKVFAFFALNKKEVQIQSVLVDDENTYFAIKTGINTAKLYPASFFSDFYEKNT